MAMLVLLVLSVAVGGAIGQDSQDKAFIFNQIMKGCLGQQFVDRSYARLITAVRRCEQTAPVPLRDQALEQIIAQLQPGCSGGQRVIYVPVPGFSGLNQFGFGANNNQFDQFGSTGFGNTGAFGNTGGFGSTSLGSNNLGFGSNNQAAGFGLLPDRRPNSNNNPFGFNLGKQAAGDKTTPVEEEQAKTETLGAEEAKSRKARQINTLSQSQLHQTKIEALQYLSNMTCVLRAASYIDHNNLPNYQFFENELRSLQMSRDLRNDMATGLIFCKELTQCMPIERLNHPLARELGQAIAYFRCTARTNVKACQKEEERRTQSNSRLTGAFFNGNGMDLLDSVSDLAFNDDSLGFDFF